jgi:hypothetical protein
MYLVMHSICLSVVQKTFRMGQSQNNNTDRDKSYDNCIHIAFAETFIAKSRIAPFRIRFDTENSLTKKSP